MAYVEMVRGEAVISSSILLISFQRSGKYCLYVFLWSPFFCQANSSSSLGPGEMDSKLFIIHVYKVNVNWMMIYQKNNAKFVMFSSVEPISLKTYTQNPTDLNTIYLCFLYRKSWGSISSIPLSELSPSSPKLWKKDKNIFIFYIFLHFYRPGVERQT